MIVNLNEYNKLLPNKQQHLLFHPRMECLAGKPCCGRAEAELSHGCPRNNPKKILNRNEKIDYPWSPLQK